MTSFFVHLTRASDDTRVTLNLVNVNTITPFNLTDNRELSTADENVAIGSSIRLADYHQDHPAESRPQLVVKNPPEEIIQQSQPIVFARTVRVGGFPQFHNTANVLYIEEDKELPGLVHIILRGPDSAIAAGPLDDILVQLQMT